MDTTASQTGASQTAAGQDETGAKRKAEQQNGTSTRTKRNRYISIAWYNPRTSDIPGIVYWGMQEWHDADGLASNECKRRKIKCNGQVPCQRCGHLDLECQCAVIRNSGICGLIDV